MSLKIFESLFRKAWLSIDKKKFLLVYFSLCICGLIIVISRVMTFKTGEWIKLSLSFAPIFLVGGLLFALGVLLIKIHQKEQVGESVSYMQIAFKSSKTLISITYITFPMLLLCLVNWVVLGFFFLLKEMPVVGDFVGIFLSFAPFLLILCSLFLVFFNVMFLFFLAPQLSKEISLDVKLWKNTLKKIIQNPLMNLIGLTVAGVPFFFVLFFLLSAAILTHKSYLPSVSPLLIGFKWFFLMLPFNALLTPAVIFFFNFSYECDKALSGQFKEAFVEKIS